ncbi:2-phospho-L-lactate guanylyltransferase [Ornithinimicrobium avium]|uniref:2-phospho-L-lactate guanylyltransferase n=1 Tax=Ornithinimicrobium avium TaxID=2283195 RepID=A0A345NIJ1_9MICO|nr:2-phospho-L-lactate guanylyltransferase [Ornithinimicrobium avium]AXH94849.1 2-phospho-L-lactate guanylyltransferase [Ornithinimicrobium avium]
MSNDVHGRATDVRWHLVVPVKEADRAKTRLAAPHPLSRPVLARAVARDTLEAACAAVGGDHLTVVTSDPVVRAAALELGAHVAPDPGRGLDAAVLAGWESHPGPAQQPGRIGWAALLGDLPALRAADLRAALRACARYPRAVVPDADGTGTVLLTSTAAPPVPRFGAGSAARHAQDAHLLDLALPRVRRDVDVVADLREAVALGVGRHTLLALGRAT